jgi:hypothetical protein
VSNIFFHSFAEDLSINITVSFRLLNLDKFQALTLIREVPSTKYAPHPNNKAFIGTVCLDEKLDNLDELNIFYVRQNIALHDCEIFIHASTDVGKHTIHTPKFVNQILKHIDCQLTFSFEQS